VFFPSVCECPDKLDENPGKVLTKFWTNQFFPSADNDLLLAWLDSNRGLVTEELPKALKTSVRFEFLWHGTGKLVSKRLLTIF
jgi:hypothetical protein